MKKEETVEEKKRHLVFQSAGVARAWLVVVTNAGKAGLVVPQLTKHDYEVYRPMAHKAVTHARQTVIKAVELYPNYLFVRGRGDTFERVSGTLGVAWIYPTLLMDGVIQRHKATEQAGFIEIAERLDPEFGKVKPGDIVQTLDGLLEVVVTETRDNNRVAALSGFMNGNSRMTVDLSKAVKRSA